jgi:hypothetical protein
MRLPNPFDSVDGLPPSPTESAAAHDPGKGDAAADISVSDAEVLPRASEPEAAASVRAAAASDICDIPEIFRVANLLCEVSRFTPDYPSIYQAMMDDNAPRLALEIEEWAVWANEVPLFLQHPS